MSQEVINKLQLDKLYNKIIIKVKGKRIRNKM